MNHQSTDDPPTDLALVAALLSPTATVAEACRYVGVPVPGGDKHFQNTLRHGFRWTDVETDGEKVLRN